MMRIKINLILVLLWLSVNVNSQERLDTEKPYQVLSGTVSQDNFHTYLEVPFTLPEGVKRLTVKFSYDTRDEKTTIDLGVADPARFRGWSGGARNIFTLSEEDATAGYLPGTIILGKWNLWLGVPNIRKGVTAHYEAKIFIDTADTVTEFSDQPIRTSAGWYYGDLHMHSGNSDGKCLSVSGKEVNTPVFKVVETAAKKNLDFMALTDHNTFTQARYLRELQPYFDNMLLVPGQEITTFFGHANAFGLTKFVDFRMTDPTYRQAMNWMKDVNKSGGVISINHPGSPTGESCMGCGWEMKDIPANVVTAVEIINGGSGPAEGPLQGLNLWHQMLKLGRKVTAIGGSDNHRPDQPADKNGGIGFPTTAIYMDNLSVKSLLDGIRKGRVFVETEGNKDHLVDLWAISGKTECHMGTNMNVQPKDKVTWMVNVKAVTGCKVEFVVDGDVHPENTRAITTDNETLTIPWKADGKYHFVYVKVKNKEDKLVMVSNPLYFNLPTQ